MKSQTNHTHMGRVHWATKIATPEMDPRRARIIIILLALCTALNMISFGMIFPLFARILETFGNGVGALASSLIAFSLAGIIAAPLMGTLADRFGRRPLLASSLAVYSLAFTGYYFAPSSLVFIIIRGLAGALTAGFGPATSGIVADISPKNERGRWFGVIGGSGSIGFIVGPILGGYLYDQFGLGIPFFVSISLCLIAFLIALIIIPETYTQEERRRARLHQTHANQVALKKTAAASFWASLPHPLPAFGILLLVNLSMIFAWFFIDPHLPFYLFDELGWSTAQFGSAISFYGWASLIGSLTLGQSSDRFGRKPVLIFGLVLHAAQYVGLMATKEYWVIALAFIISGLGESIVNPALSVSFLDITPDEHRARAMGIKTAIGNLGSLTAPALMLYILQFVPPQRVFSVSSGIILCTALIVFVALRLPSRTEVARYSAWEVSQDRIMAVQTALHNVAVSASTARKLKKNAGAHR